MADILDIACADALLAGRHTLARRNFRACKIRLQRSPFDSIKSRNIFLS